MNLLDKILKLLLFLGAILMTPFLGAAKAESGSGSAYDYGFDTLEGEKMPLSAYKGKVLLVVNTASKCGFTPQYEGLEKLYETYKDKGFVVIGVPSNDFGQQEPGSATEIRQFCQSHYGVSFPITSKQVVTGADAHPLFKWLRERLGFGSAPKWNFHKYLIDANGQPVGFFLSTTSPDSDALRRAIEQQLEKPK